ncbi:hypothetical protein [Leptolyngbya sp. FACHB-16]|nr:hypothetical protein [Leptolyngbya sp. FACHB-16]MBD1912550.1 hypothetical protein [Leptolyngbya sp. FACHB-8]MBD2154903.1 hypothetical protein [Leptolyngbya sp. FACHB-16]
MPESLWYFLPFIVVALVSGGIGAFLYAVITPHFNYRFTIAQRIDILPKFDALYGAEELRSQLTFSNGKQSYPYSDLHVVQVEMTNESPHNFDNFEFGINLPSQATMVYIEAQSPDRHRLVKTLTPLTFEQPQSQVDINLQPFNRTDTYRFRLLLLAAEGCPPSDQITLTSAEAVRFVNLPSTEQILKKAAKSVALPLGPFKLSFR